MQYINNMETKTSWLSSREFTSDTADEFTMSKLTSCPRIAGDALM